MKLPNFLYRSERVGKNGKPFSLYKIKTLKDGFTGQFANDVGYTKFGKFLRKTKLDELPQVFNVLKGDLALVGPRPMNPEDAQVLPRDIRKTILSIKPGLTSLASIHFTNEEALLKSSQGAEIYHAKIKPIKLILDAFYVEHKGFLLDCWILYRTGLLVLKSLFT